MKVKEILKMKQFRLILSVIVIFSRFTPKSDDIQKQTEHLIWLHERQELHNLSTRKRECLREYSSCQYNKPFHYLFLINMLTAYNSDIFFSGSLSVVWLAWTSTIIFRTRLLPQQTHISIILCLKAVHMDFLCFSSRLSGKVHFWTACILLIPFSSF